MLARDHGHPQSTHVGWLGLAGRNDHVIARRAVDGGFVLVTHNAADFRALYGREGLHVGLVTLNTPAKMMSLDLQRRLFLLAMGELGSDQVYNLMLELTVDRAGGVRVERYPLPD